MDSLKNGFHHNQPTLFVASAVKKAGMTSQGSILLLKYGSITSKKCFIYFSRTVVTAKAGVIKRSCFIFPGQ